MQDLFKGYYQPTPEQFKEMWEEGTFVFDTNVLLNLYRYKEESKDEILNVIKKLKGRIWIPYQVGLEFHRNRLNVLSEQNSKLSAIKSSIKKSINNIESECKNLELDKRHSDIETSSFMGRFKELSNSVISELDEIKPKILTNDTQDDSILTEITSLFNFADGTLGAPPVNQEVLDNIYKEGVFRAKNRIPPSFEDILKADKNESDEKYYAFEGLNYKKGYGDLILWKQINEYARETKKKSIVFITDDKKQDWMRVINSHGKKTISARPELVSEIFKEAGVERFYIYDTDGYLKYSKEYLETNVSDQTLEDVENYSNISFRKNFEKLQPHNVDWSISEYDIKAWLDENYKFPAFPNEHHSFDLLALDNKNFKEAVLLKYLNQNGYEALVSSVLDDLERFVSSQNIINRIHFVLVLPKFEHQKYDIELIVEILNSKITEFSPKIIFGYEHTQVKFSLVYFSIEDNKLKDILLQEFNSFKQRRDNNDPY